MAVEEASRASLGFVGVFVVLEVVIFCLYALFTDYDPLAKGGDENADTDANLTMEQLYPFFQDVHVMIFIGFGFLMTFMRRYMLGAISFTLLIAAFSLQWSILCNGFWHRVFESESWDHAINLDMATLISGDFAAGAVLITYGAVIGKIGPLEMIILAFFELIFYAINESIGVGMLEAVDMGGSMFVHLFGALFGVAASMVLSNKQALKQEAMQAPKLLGGGSYNSDTFSMIGAVFLWMYWPSFNGALAVGTARHRVVVNTVLSLTASATNSFLVSHILNGGKFSMVDVQNATLAGGVAVGSSCDMVVGAFGALIIGTVAGIVSTLGFNRLQPFLEEKIGLHDTCGVLNLHGIPGMIGGIAGAITAATTADKVFGQDITSVFPARADGRTAAEQAQMQSAALFITVGIALFGGVLSAIVVKLMSPILLPPGDRIFRDTMYFNVEDPSMEPLEDSFCEGKKV